MAPDHRDPLGPISLNATASSSRKPYIAPKDRPLASIFTSKRRATPLSSPATASSPPDIVTPESSQDDERPASPVRKRARLSVPDDEDVMMDDVEVEKGAKIRQYFASPRSPVQYVSVEKESASVMEIEPVRAENVWVRPRRRMGVAAYRPALDVITPAQPFQSYLSTFTHSLKPFTPNTLPSSIHLPSLHPPTGRPRDYSPALCVQFNHAAKLHTASSAKDGGYRRLMAIAGEEGGMRIVDIDAPQEYHRESGGFWWRAHANAIFDCKFSEDDNRIMTGSGDQTTRIHALDGPKPTLLATLRGHTSSVKATAFFDPNRSGTDASKGPIVATAGRDGNILIFDMRCKGQQLDGAGVDEYASRRTGRERDRYSAGIPGFSPKREGEELDPVMVIRGAHAEIGSGRRIGSRSTARSVTSLIALRAMPGTLASGGSADGIVKLWDLRFPTPTNRHPDPRPSHSAALFLPDPTTFGAPSSRRPRGIHSIVESPLTGDIYVLTGDSKIHTLRPTYAAPLPMDEDPSSAFFEGILPETYADERLRATSFFVRMALSSDGRYLAAGSGRGGVVAFDTQASGGVGRAGGVGGTGGGGGGEKKGMFFELEGGEDFEHRTREISSVDWGNGCLAACADDRTTRVWKSSEGGQGEEDEWGTIGAV